MSNAGRAVYIAGAGIAGLTLALALAKFGARVVVLERNAGIQEFGAGLQISPNARRVLNHLGLDRQMRTRSFEPEGIDVYSRSARHPLATLRLGEAVKQRFGAPYAVMHRADLADILYKACRRFANIDIAFSVTAFDIDSHARGVSIAADEGNVAGRSGGAFAFVGADGVYSHTRTNLLGGPRPTYSGYVSWRALVDFDELPVAKDRTSLFMGPGYHAVCYPLPKRGKLNLVFFHPEDGNQVFGPSPPTGPSLKHPAPIFEALLTAGAGKWGFWPLNALEEPVWFSGNIGLVGDAAHAMVPFQAQGAAMGIEDAAILAPLLITEPTGEAAFRRYAALRMERVRRVMAESRTNGWRFHLGWPMSVARDTVIRMQGPEGQLRRLDWLYGYDPAPEVDMPAPPRRRSSSSLNV